MAFKNISELGREYRAKNSATHTPEYHTLGRTNLSVSKLALGTVELGMDYGIPTPGYFGRPTETDAIRLVHTALDQGINLIDTARAYGESEQILGKALCDRRGGVVLATKVIAHQPDGILPTGRILHQQMMSSLETSLRMLQTDVVDIWMIHNVDGVILKQHEEIREVFERCQQAGKIRWTGGSFYGVDEAQASLKLDFFDVYQVTYSVLDQRLADHFFPMALERNVGIVARSVLLKGVLTKRADDLPSRLEVLREYSRRFRQRLAEADIGLTPPQAAIAFAATQPYIHSILLGVRSQAELVENLASVACPLPVELLEALYMMRLEDEHYLNPHNWQIS